MNGLIIPICWMKIFLYLRKIFDMGQLSVILLLMDHREILSLKMDVEDLESDILGWQHIKGSVHLRF